MPGKLVRRDPYYDELGKRSATAFMYNWICKYIRFERDLVEFADIAHVPVQKPMLIVGFGRTGSTFLHQLLALDPQARAPQMWELTEPSPPPRPEFVPDGFADSAGPAAHRDKRGGHAGYSKDT